MFINNKLQWAIMKLMVGKMQITYKGKILDELKNINHKY